MLTIQNRSPIKMIFTQLIGKAKAQSPFGHLYQQIVLATYRMDVNKTAANKQDVAVYIQNILNAKDNNYWKQQLQQEITKFQQANPQCDINQEENLLQIFNTVFSHRNFIPDEGTWMQKPTEMADLLFPRSNIGTPVRYSIINNPNSDTNPSEYISANSIENITILAGPKNQTMNVTYPKFFDAILQLKPKQIIALGFAGNSTHHDFIDYFSYDNQYGNYQIKISQGETNCESKVTITHNTTSTSHTTTVINLKVSDNTPFSLDNTSLKHLEKIIQKSDEGLFIHCASGLGRSGQLHFIIALLKEIEKSSILSETFDFFIEYPQETTEKDLTLPNHYEQAATIIQDTLNRLRKVRYTIQAEKQFDYALTQTLLLRAIRLNKDDDYLNQLRTELGIKEKHFLNQIFGKPEKKVQSGTAFFANKNHVTSQQLIQKFSKATDGTNEKVSRPGSLTIKQ